MKSDNYSTAVQLSAEGLNARQIAEEMGVSLPSVYRYLQQMQKTLAIMSTSGLTPMSSGSFETRKEEEEILHHSEEEFEFENELEEEQVTHIETTDHVNPLSERELALREREAIIHENTLRTKRNKVLFQAKKQFSKLLSEIQSGAEDEHIERLRIEILQSLLEAYGFDQDLVNASEIGDLLNTLDTLLCSDIPERKAMTGVKILREEMNASKGMKGLGIDSHALLTEISNRYLGEFVRLINSANENRLEEGGISDFLNFLEELESELIAIDEEDFVDEISFLIEEVRGALIKARDRINSSLFNYSARIDLDQEIVERIDSLISDFETAYQ